MDRLSRTINPTCVRSRRAEASKELGKCPAELKPYYKTLLPENLGTHFRDWPAGVQMKYKCLSKSTASHMTS